VTVRPVGQGDEAPLRAFLTDLSANSLRLRYFTGGANVADAAHWAAGTPADRYGLLAHDETGVLVAHAVYVQLDQTRAEVAVEVADHLHGRGLGTILMEQIGAVAEERGITQFVAEVLPENRAMLDVFRDGFDAHVAFHEGPETVEFPTAAWRLARERFGEDTTRSSRTGSVDVVVLPQSIRGDDPMGDSPRGESLVQASE
jgi:GNAT superfamily N-acetyltransferase